LYRHVVKAQFDHHASGHLLNGGFPYNFQSSPLKNWLVLHHIGSMTSCRHRWHIRCPHGPEPTLRRNQVLPDTKLCFGNLHHQSQANATHFATVMKLLPDQGPSSAQCLTQSLFVVVRMQIMVLFLLSQGLCPIDRGCIRTARGVKGSNLLHHVPGIHHMV